MYKHRLFVVLLSASLLGGCGSTGDMLVSEQRSSNVALVEPRPTPTVSPTPSPAPPRPDPPLVLAFELSALDLDAYSQIRARVFDADGKELLARLVEVGAELRTEDVSGAPTRVEVTLLADGVGVARAQVNVPPVSGGLETVALTPESFSVLSEATLQGEYAVFIPVGDGTVETSVSAPRPPRGGIRGRLNFDGAGGLAEGSYLDFFQANPAHSLSGPPTTTLVHALELGRGSYTVDTTNAVKMTLHTRNFGDLVLKGHATDDAFLPHPESSEEGEYQPSGLVSAKLDFNEVTSAALMVKPATGEASKVSRLGIGYRTAFALLGSRQSNTGVALTRLSFFSDGLSGLESNPIVTFLDPARVFTYEQLPDESYRLVLRGDAFTENQLHGQSGEIEAVVARNGAFVGLGTFDALGAVVYLHGVPLGNAVTVSDVVGDYHAVRADYHTAVPAYATTSVMSFDGVGTWFNGSLGPFPYFELGAQVILEGNFDSPFVATPDGLYALLELSRSTDGSVFGWSQVVKGVTSGQSDSR